MFINPKFAFEDRIATGKEWCSHCGKVVETGKPILALRANDDFNGFNMSRYLSVDCVYDWLVAPTDKKPRFFAFNKKPERVWTVEGKEDSEKGKKSFHRLSRLMDGAGEAEVIRERNSKPVSSSPPPTNERSNNETPNTLFQIPNPLEGISLSDAD